jgi:hypothetical protein
MKGNQAYEPPNDTKRALIKALRNAQAKIRALGEAPEEYDFSLLLLMPTENLKVLVEQDLQYMAGNLAMYEEYVKMPESLKVVVERDENHENIVVRIGDKVVECKEYETDYWVAEIVAACGGTYEEVMVEGEEM